MKIPCQLCERLILPSTADANEGLCAQCNKLSLNERQIKKEIKAGLDTLDYIVSEYRSLINSIELTCCNKYLCAIGDPMFESVSLYTQDDLKRSYSYDSAQELCVDRVYKLSMYTSEIEGNYSLFSPLLNILKDIAPRYNLVGKTVSLGSWGMAPAEIGWIIRHLNDRPNFEDYLKDADIKEQEVDSYDTSYAKKTRTVSSARPKMS